MTARPQFGEFTYDDIKLEYQVILLEYHHSRRRNYLHIEAICLNPLNSWDREMKFVFQTNNFSSNDEKLKIAFTILKSVIDNLGIASVFKLNIKNGNVFYMKEICNGASNNI